jgi:ATP-dependent RNA helicase DDX27
MLFSATMTEQIDELVKLSLNKPIRLEADPSLKRPATLTEEYALSHPCVFNIFQRLSCD